MSSNDLQSRNGQPSEQDSVLGALAVLITAATATWQATIRLTIVCTALALPATATLILFLLIR